MVTKIEAAMDSEEVKEPEAMGSTVAGAAIRIAIILKGTTKTTIIRITIIQVITRYQQNNRGNNRGQRQANVVVPQSQQQQQNQPEEDMANVIDLLRE